eukprot:CAMPEP_0180661810 /NCGR_PEP_ID=MMETSP1037_2-20121125/59045_1 /TAXON_ID=632150 /ORGANISM="Azadinium spinosum, Strain 3D9" /LENGTH=287 /DNA_ID=CAMNT_0022689407 /DNA_START=142 /DNA_END=1007 /DNA_ORIENTATION=+
MPKGNEPLTSHRRQAPADLLPPSPQGRAEEEVDVRHFPAVPLRDEGLVKQLVDVEQELQDHDAHQHLLERCCCGQPSTPQAQVVDRDGKLRGADQAVDQQLRQPRQGDDAHVGASLHEHHLAPTPTTRHPEHLQGQVRVRPHLAERRRDPHEDDQPIEGLVSHARLAEFVPALVSAPQFRAKGAIGVEDFLVKFAVPALHFAHRRLHNMRADEHQDADLQEDVPDIGDEEQEAMANARARAKLGDILNFLDDGEDRGTRSVLRNIELGPEVFFPVNAVDYMQAFPPK